MVTGDNKNTAFAIAKECKIIPADATIDANDDMVMEGPEFFARVGGLWCLICDKKSPCDETHKVLKEGVGNK